MTNLRTLPKCIRMCMTIGNLPTSYMESLTYEEQLLWFCKFLQEEVIPVVNNNSEVVLELQNWFKTLDVQEEVNNKLEEMAQSGELEEIIAAYINSNAILSYNTVSDLKTATNLINGSTAKTLGYYNINDKGEALYKIRNIKNTDVVDDMFIISLNNEELIAELIIENKNINIKQLGAKGDNLTDNINIINNALNYLETTGGSVFIPSGVYIVSSAIEMPSNTKLYGEGMNTIIKASSNFNTTLYNTMIKPKTMSMDNTENTSEKNLSIENISLDNNSVSNAAKEGLIQFRGVVSANIKNVDININGDNCWGIVLFSANKYINIDNVKIDNTSEDNNLGGCLWIRSGLAALGADSKKSYGINVTNSNFSSTAKDELVVITDGIAGGYTEANISNCYFNGKATNTYSSYLLIIEAKGDDTSHVKANINNVTMIGKVSQFAMVIGSNGRAVTCLDPTISNVNINVSAGKGIRSYNRDYIVSNAVITTSGTNDATNNVTITNSKLYNRATSSNVYNCNITANDIGCENCPVVVGSIIKSNTHGLHTYGSFKVRYENNEIYSKYNGIYAQVVSNNSIFDSIISGNYISRIDNSSNAGYIGINCQYSKNCQLVNNRIIGVSGNTAGNYQGFQYATNSSNSTGLSTTENNVTYLAA